MYVRILLLKRYISCIWYAHKKLVNDDDKHKQSNNNNNFSVKT